MNAHLKRYRITLKALGPVHIGSGQRIGKKEYMYDKNKGVIYYPDTKEMIKALQKAGQLARYEGFLLNNDGRLDLRKFLTENRVDTSAFIGRPISIKGIADEDFGRFSEIQTFVKDAYGQPLVPGSSVKGFFRTVILTEMLRRKRKNEGISFDGLKPGERKPKDTKDIESDILNVLGRNKDRRIDAVNDVMTAFRFSDSDPIDRDCLTICRKIDASPKTSKGEPKPMPVFRECLKPGSEIILTLTVDTQMMKQIKQKEFRTLFERIEYKTKNGEVREILYFMGLLQSFNNSYHKDFREFFDNIEQYRGDVIYLGGGTGFLSKTMLLGLYDNPKRLLYIADYLDAQFRSHNHQYDKTAGVSPRKLKLTKYGGKDYEMGKCVIKIEEIGGDIL